MEMIQRMMASIDYIESRLDQPLDIDEIAKVACLSKFHYQRMYHMLTGVTVAEYIRRRRLTFAVQDLLNGSQKVIDMAFRYGYETPEA
jgi:AraC family transcriptional regulator